jgi:hypothetical protein
MPAWSPSTARRLQAAICERLTVARQRPPVPAFPRADVVLCYHAAPHTSLERHTVLNRRPPEVASAGLPVARTATIIPLAYFATSPAHER